MIFRVLWWILCIFEWVVLWQNIHIIGAWLNWLSIKALPNSLALSSFKYFLIALQAWCLTGQCGINFWYVFDNLRLSIVIPSNWISTDTLTIIDPIFRLCFKRFFFPSTINWTFPGFALMSSFKLIWVNFEPIKKIFISFVLKITQKSGKAAPMGKQNVIICKTTNVWLFNNKKNVINKNIEKQRSQYGVLRNSTNDIGPITIMQNQFLPSVYGNFDNYLLTVNSL